MVQSSTLEQPVALQQTPTRLSLAAQVATQMNMADEGAFEVKYQQYWQQASEQEQLLTVMICEVDEVARFRAQHKRKATMTMLSVVVLTIQKFCLEHDAFLSLYDGDKFALLFTGSDAQSMQQLAEQLRMAVEASHHSEKYSEPVSISLGLSCAYPETPRMLLKKSRQALARAQVAGHNQVMIAGQANQQESTELLDSADLLCRSLDQQSPLTNYLSEMMVLNQYQFNRHFAYSWQQASEEQDLLSMILCELDFFSEYQEQFFNHIGDDMLLHIAQVLQKVCQSFKVKMAHLMGGKFVLLVQGGNATLGFKIAQALQQALSDAAIAHYYSPLKETFTMSIGLANCLPCEASDMQQLMQHAHHALNEAQGKGYDQIAVAE